MKEKHSCTKCDRAFNSKMGLSMHVEAKHPEGQLLSWSAKRQLKRVLWIAVVLLVIVGATFFLMQRNAAKEEIASDIFEVKADDWVVGNANVAVTLIEYADFECESCKAYYPLVKQLKGEYKDDARIVLRYYPLPGHPNSMIAARAAHAAGQQGKFWEMHDKLFETQSQWGERKQKEEYFFTYAQQLGLDMDQFRKDFYSEETIARIERDKKEGTIAGVQGTPTFFLNGQQLRNPKNYDDFATLIDAAIIQSPIMQEKVDGELVHEHADLAVYLDGVQLNLSQEKYQSGEGRELHPYTHVHDGFGYILHKHKTGITLQEFFGSLNMTFNNSCFVTDEGAQYCNNGNKKIQLIVNGTMNDKYGTYELHDNDRILITYDSAVRAQQQIVLVTDQACIFSKTCPERGEPPTEHCVGGLGTECE